MVTFTKFGSCVTTDLFNFLNMSKYYPQYVYTGINIDTALSQADISVPEECIVAESGFWIKMQKYCFHHEPFDNLIKNLQSDFFIFDLCDERLPLQNWGGTLVPVTWETYRTSLQLRKKQVNIDIEDWHLANRNKELYEKSIRNFMQSIKKCYDPMHIIYISMRQADYALDRSRMKIIPIDECPKKGLSDLQRRKKENAVIDFAESIMKEEMPDIWYINTPDNLIADTGHHFTLHPLHFHYFVYEYLADCVEEIADFNANKLCSRQKVQLSMDIKKHWLQMKLDTLEANES